MIEEKEIEPVHAWRRYFAKTIDLTLVSMITSVIASFVFKDIVHPFFLSSLVGGILSYLILILVETVMITYYGTTIGKLIYNIRIEKKEKN